MVLPLFNHRARLLSRQISLRPKVVFFLPEVLLTSVLSRVQSLVSVLSAIETSHLLFLSFLRKAKGYKEYPFRLLALPWI